MEALEKYKENNWDVILMDCQMPRMSGYEASKEIRRLEQNTSRHDTIIALTANSLEGDEMLCLDAGMDAFLPKPLRKGDLFAAIEKFTRP